MSNESTDVIPDGEYCDGCPYYRLYDMTGLAHCSYLDKVLDLDMKECGING